MSKLAPDAACYPHPAELTKRGRIEEESVLKNVPVDEHPGWGWWLCKPCGTWHPGATPAPQ